MVLKYGKRGGKDMKIFGMLVAVIVLSTFLIGCAPEAPDADEVFIAPAEEVVAEEYDEFADLEDLEEDLGLEELEDLGAEFEI